MDDLISSESAGEGLWRIHNAMGEVCYLVEGAREAALVDTMGGFGDLGALVVGLIGKKPVKVLLCEVVQVMPGPETLERKAT